MAISRFEVYLVNLDPTIGSEIKKTRPCLVVSPDEMNHNIRTVIIAPMTTSCGMAGASPDMVSRGREGGNRGTGKRRRGTTAGAVRGRLAVPFKGGPR